MNSASDLPKAATAAAEPTTAGKRGMGVLPMFGKFQTPTALVSEIQNSPALATRASSIPASVQPVVFQAQPMVSAPAFVAAAVAPMQSDVAADVKRLEQPISTFPAATVPPTPMPVVEIAAAPTVPTMRSDVAADVRKLERSEEPAISLVTSAATFSDEFQLPVFASGKGQAAPLKSASQFLEDVAERLPVPHGAESASAATSARSPEIEMHPPLTVASLPAAGIIPAPLPLVKPVVTQPGLGAVPTTTVAPVAEMQQVLPGQEVPAPAAQPLLAKGRRVTSITVSPVPVAQKIPVPMSSAVAAIGTLVAKKAVTKPDVARDSLPVAEPERKFVSEVTDPSYATPVLMGNPMAPVVVEPTAVGEPRITETKSTSVPVVSVPSTEPGAKAGCGCPPGGATRGLASTEVKQTAFAQGSGSFGDEFDRGSFTALRPPSVGGHDRQRRFAGGGKRVTIRRSRGCRTPAPTRGTGDHGGRFGGGGGDAVQRDPAAGRRRAG